MELKVLRLSISYSSVKWTILLGRLRVILKKFPIEQTLLFFNTEKGDVVRLAIFYRESFSKNIECSLVQNMKDFLIEQPSKRNKSNLKPGESLWMNYPNNQLLLDNFKQEHYFIKNTNEKNVLFGFSSLISSWLFENPPSKGEMISTFMQMVILMNRFFQIDKIEDEISMLIDRIEEKFELRQQPKLRSEIYGHVREDLQFNSHAIIQLMFCNDLPEFYSNKFLEFYGKLKTLGLNKGSFLVLYKQIINQIILHFGLDYRIQLYVLLMIKHCLIIENQKIDSLDNV